MSFVTPTSAAASVYLGSSSAEQRDRSPALLFDQNSLHLPLMYHRLHALGSNPTPTDTIVKDAWSCILVFITFWLLASLTLIVGFYGPSNLLLGPNCSQLLRVNPLFVQSIEVQEIYDANPGVMLYEFAKVPPMDTEVTWLETHNALIQPVNHKEWHYFLNKGSKLVISYNVKSPNHAFLPLIIAEGRESFAQWIEDPSHPNITLSWNMIHGSGMMEQEILSSKTHYIALSNLNSEVAEVDLHFQIMAIMYNTTLAHHKCSLSQGTCSLTLFLSGESFAVLTSPSPEEGVVNNYWNIKLSYNPRWITYFIGSAPMTILIFLGLKTYAMYYRRDEARHQVNDIASRRDTLLSPKDDDISSWGSSYDSLSNDEDDLDECPGAVSHDLDQPKVVEGNASRLLCAICVDALRDSFFIPCGHCAACFTCATRIVEEAGTCPVCRRAMKKVRKIITV